MSRIIRITTSMFIVTYCCRFEEILVSASWRWRDNSAETCKINVQDCKHKL